MRKDDLNVHVFQNRNWFNLKSDRWIFFLALAVRGAFHGKAFRWGKILGTGLISEKNGSFVCKTNERAEATTSNYSATTEFLQYIYSALVA